MIELYKYQVDGVDGIKSEWTKGRNRVIYQLPTGGGKTVIFSWIAQKVSKKGNKVLIISHRIELLTQAGGTLEEFGVSPFVVTSNVKEPQDADVCVAMTGTLKNRVKLPEWEQWWKKFDLIVIDECHRADFNWIIKYEGSIHKLGVTASPKRTGKMPQLLTEYDTIVFGPDVQEMINMGKLMPDRHFGVPVDLTGVTKDPFGEYRASDLYERYNTPQLYSGFIDNWKRICPGVPTICFCVNIQHVIETTKRLNEAGIKAKFVTSRPSKPNKPTTCNPASQTLYLRKKREYDNYTENYTIYSGERTEIIQQWKNGLFDILVNAGILIEGFDHKPTMCVAVNLATTSENKWLQMIGRGSRPSPGKEFFYILDFGENATRLGHYRQQREYSLTHKQGRGEGVPPSKLCPKCNAMVLASARICKYCGFEFPKSEKEKLAELVEHEYANYNPKEVDLSKLTVPQLEEYCRQRGYKKAYLWRLIYIHKGEDELKKYAQRHGYHWAWAQRVVKQIERTKNVRKK